MMGKVLISLFLTVACAISSNAIFEQDGTKVLPGQNAAIGIFPFMASMIDFRNGSFLCAGSIIHKNWILTSAECIYPYESTPNLLRVRVGGVQITVNEPGEQEIVPFKMVIHPGFKPAAGPNSGNRLDQDYYNNIGLIELATDINVNAGAATAALAEATETIVPGDTVVLAGWGGVTDTSPVDNLQYSTNLHIMTKQDCYNAVPGTVFDSFNICTAPYPDATACKYDHGGPLFISAVPRGTVILGVVNYAPCWDSNHPTVYASVPAHRSWIFAMSGV